MKMSFLISRDSKFLYQKLEQMEIENAELDNKNNEMEIEIAELKKDKEYLDKINNEQTEVILKLNEKIEKMKCCENCTKHRKAECSEDKKFFARVKRTCNEWEFDS